MKHDFENYFKFFLRKKINLKSGYLRCQQDDELTQNMMSRENGACFIFFYIWIMVIYLFQFQHHYHLQRCHQFILVSPSYISHHYHDLHSILLSYVTRVRHLRTTFQYHARPLPSPYIYIYIYIYLPFIYIICYLIQLSKLFQIIQ